MGDGERKGARANYMNLIRTSHMGRGRDASNHEAVCNLLIKINPCQELVSSSMEESSW